MRVATYNLQNLRLRTRDGRHVLDGAADHDADSPLRPTELSWADRVETARVIACAEADVVGLQEVFDQATLDFFHDRFVINAGSQTYPFRYCLAGNDGRGRNVAALCQREPIHVRSNAALTGANLRLSDLHPDLLDRPIFRRDCLELEFDTFMLFVCHFKAPYPDAAKAHAVRSAEALAVRKIIEARFPEPGNGRWIILGDFNEPESGSGSSTSALEPLKSAFAIDLLDRMASGTDWTYEMPDSHFRTRPDRILVSPRLAQEFPRVRPQILRTGMSAEGANSAPPHASDHALIYADFPGL